MQAYVLQEKGSLLEIVDPRLGPKVPKSEVLGMLNIALSCTNGSPSLRPSMSAVVGMLEGKIPVQAPLIKGSLDQDARFKALEMLSHDSQTLSTAFSQESQSQSSMSMDGPWRDADSSLQNTDEHQDCSPSALLLRKD